MQSLTKLAPLTLSLSQWERDVVGRSKRYSGIPSPIVLACKHDVEMQARQGELAGRTAGWGSDGSSFGRPALHPHGYTGRAEAPAARSCASVRVARNPG